MPTFFLIIGYPIYWLELYFFKVGHGQTTPLAWIIFSIFSFIVFSQNRPFIITGIRRLRTWFLKELLFIKLLLGIMMIGAGMILLCALHASLLPPHLAQEFDAINYHIALPRQHLLLGSFSHISWSSADLYFLPVDFALAPFWLVTSLPNKFPQFIFFLGLLGVCGRLAWRFSKGKMWAPLLAVAAVLGSHNVGIQAGTAMLDVALCYLFLAALDNFLRGEIWFGVIEATFYFWSKPLIPVQVLVTLAAFGLFWFLLRVLGARDNTWVVDGEKIKRGSIHFRHTLTKGIIVFLILSVFVAGPFSLKSLRYSGTPIFPLGVGSFQAVSVLQSDARWAEIKIKAAQLLSYKDAYGSGRDFKEFVKHFWLVAVPEEGVNNRYDYPLGLMYLLFLGPFLLLFLSSLRKKVLPLLFLVVVVSWGIWWLGCQQTRYLYVPLVLMYVSVAASIKIPSRIMLSAMLIAMLLVVLSVYRANRHDWGRWGEVVLREKDKELVALGKDIPSAHAVSLPFYDIAYATFPVEVTNSDSIFVFKTTFSEDK